MTAHDVSSNCAPVVCRAKVTKDVAFQIAIDPRAASGDGGHPPDPISQAYLKNDYAVDLPLLRLMLALVKPGATVLDLGAHLGTFSLTAAAAGCRVLSVEASPHNARLLRESVRANGWEDRLQIVHSAVARQAGVVQFAAYGPWGHVQTDEVDLPAVEVPAIRLDDLLATHGERLDFIKMDIEGSEMAALEGGAGVLGRTDAPPLLYESNYIGLHYYQGTPRQLREALAALGYVHHYWIRPGRLVEVGIADFQPEIVGEYLTTKQPLKTVPGWRIDARPSHKDVIRAVLANGRCEVPGVRMHLGRALQHAPDEILDDYRVNRVLHELTRDTQAKVREAVAWFDRQPGPGFFGRLVQRLRSA